MESYFLIKQQREIEQAPVDTMGCYSIGFGHKGDIKKFHILVGLLFSSQTKDEVTYSAMVKLTKLLGIITPENILKMAPEEIHSCISKIGYHNKKLKYLIDISKKVINKMPTCFEEVIKLPGIGRKMAYLYLFYGCERVEGISVDTHVHRISNRIGLVQSKNPEETRKSLELKLDKTEWNEINRVLVGFGQVICLPIKPKCNMCYAKNICPSSNNKMDF